MLLETHDPEDFTETIQPIAPGARVRGIGRTFHGRLRVAPFERIGLFRVSGSSLQGDLPADAELVALTIPTRAGFLAGTERPDREIEGSDAHVHAPGSSFTFRLTEASEALVVALKPPVLSDFLSGLNADLSEVASAREGVLSLATPAGAMLRRYLDTHWEESVNRDLALFPAVARTVEASLMTMVALALDTPKTTLLPAKPASIDAVKRAVDYISEHFREPLSLAEIARAASLPVRSLTRAFRDHFQVSPMEMVRDRRLDTARQALEAAQPHEITVAEAAREVGIGHLGRFAAAYQARFGEFPSETLTRYRRLH